MYFDKFPKIYYDFKIGQTEELKVVTDVTRNVRIIKDILSNVTMYDEYDIKEGETPEIIADKFYGSPEYHWVVMLTNERYDYINDFPLPYAELEKHINTKYGSRFVEFDSNNPLIVNITNDLITINNHGFNTGDIVEYSTRGNKNIGGIYDGKKYLIIKVSDNQFKLADNRKNAFSGVPINFPNIIDWIDNQNNKIVWLNQFESVTLWSSNILSLGEGIHQLKISNQYKTHHFEDANGNIVNENYVNVRGIAEEVYPVSNYEYEERLNDSKRRIKIVSPTLLPIILKNFEEII